MIWFRCNKVGISDLKEYSAISPNSALQIPVEIQQSTDKIEFEFYHLLTQNSDGLIGSNNTTSQNYTPLWINNSKFVFYGYTLSQYTITNGYHKFVYDPTTSTITIDDVVIDSGITIASTTDSLYLLGCRTITPTGGTVSPYIGYIKRFKVTNTSNNKVRCDYLAGVKDGISYMVDAVNNIYITAPRLYSFDLSTCLTTKFFTKSIAQADATVTFGILDGETILESEDVLYSSVPSEAEAKEFGCVKVWFANGYWNLRCTKPCLGSRINYINTDLILTWAYNENKGGEIIFNE